MRPDAAPVVVISEPGRTPLHLVLGRPLTVGRECDGLLLADAELSRRHVRLSATGARVIVQDLGSTNGTEVDGMPIVGPVGVEAGQVVTFGRCRLEVLASVVPAVGRDVSGDDPSRRTAIDAVAAAVASEPALFSAALLQGGTLTIVFSDIEQSRRRGEELGDDAWLKLLTFHNSLVRRQVERGGGTEVKSQGDGFMLAFPSARAAVLCSIEVMRALETHARSRPTDALRIRIGIHTGEAMAGYGDLESRAVVLAACIANQARGGEILVSSLVREIVEARGDLRFATTRRVEFQGLRGSCKLHALDWSRRDG